MKSSMRPPLWRSAFALLCHKRSAAALVVALAVTFARAFDTDLAAQSAAPISADTVYRVRLLDGSTLFGRLENRTDGGFTLTTSNGVRAEISLAQVREVGPASGRIVDGEYWSPDPNPSRLFFAPTARSVGHGNGYVGTFMVGLPFVAIGVTDRITLAAGAPVLLGVVDPFYIAPKIQLVSTPGVSVAAGVLSVISFRDDELFGGFKSFGVLYGVTTLGNADHALTAGVGYGYAGDDIAGRPVIMVGGETRASRRLKLITENYYVPGDFSGVLTGGIRFVGERFTSDIGVLGAFGGCCVPLVNFSYSFGRRQ